MHAEPAFWQRHLLWPAVLFCAVFASLELFDLDRAIARAWYFDEATRHWVGTGAGAWWARDMLHAGGRWIVRVVVAAAMTLWALSYAAARLRHFREDARFVAIAIITSVVGVGLLKAITNVDCPWDLAGFGGDNPYVNLFADRPDWLPRAKCFPGAHSSSGFALLCFYFMLRDRARGLALASLAAALSVGIAFSIGQEARGAHFLSHDLASAAIVWFVQLTLYVLLPSDRPVSS